MIGDNYILEKEKLNDFDNNFSEKKIYEVNDGSNSNYSSRKIKYQLSQLFNLNSLMNFSEGVLMIPLQLKVDLTNARLDASGNTVEGCNKIKKLFSIKSGSLISGLVLRVNGQHVISYNSNLNELIEFNYLTGCYKGNEDEYKRALLSTMDERFVEYGVGPTNSDDTLGYSKSMSYINNDKFVADNTLGTKTGNNVELENNQLIVDRGNNRALFFEKITKPGTLTNERQNNIVSNFTGANNGTSYTLNYYVCLKLKDIHPFFNQLGISRAFIDFDLDINLGTTSISYTTLSTSTNLYNLPPTVVNNFNGNTNPIYFNVDGVKNTGASDANVWWKNGGQSVGEIINFTANLDIDKTIGTKLYVPVYKLKPSINELYIKDPVRTIKYMDYLYYNQNSVTTGSSINFTISNALTNAKYLLIVPQLLNNKVTPFNSSLVLHGPLSLTNLQSNKGGSLFNANLVYSYDMFVNYIENVNNVNGGKDWINNQITFEKWNKIYRMYFFDLSLLNNEKDVAYNLSVQYINNNNFSIDVDYYIFEEKELVFNKLNGSLGDVAKSQQ